MSLGDVLINCKKIFCDLQFISLIANLETQNTEIVSILEKY